MKHSLYILPCCLILAGAFHSFGQPLRLAPPRLVFEESFFQRPIAVRIEFDMENATVFYQINDGKVLPYRKPIRINKTCQLKAYSAHPDFAISLPVVQSFTKVAHLPNVFLLQSRPHPDYPGAGANSLINFKQGSNDLHDGQWLGFSGDTVVVEAEFFEKTRVREVIVSALNHPGAWVFPMRKIAVYQKTNSDQWQLAGQWEMDTTIHAAPSPPPAFRQSVPLKGSVQKLKLVIYPYGPLPDWHPGKGSAAWLFLDEILFQ